jgi:hypothetical protein
MKQDKNQLVKWDNNFLNCKNWLINSRGNIKSFSIELPNGIYEISTTEKVDRLPDRVDKTILYYLLLSNKPDVITTRYKVAHGVFDKRSGYDYKRIMLALERWISVTIKFEGVFFEGDGYTSRIFHVIDEAVLRDDGKLHVRFNQSFFKQQQETHYMKYVNFQEFKILKSPVSAALYEHLIGKFKGRDAWKTGIIKLAKNLTMSREYPSQILLKLKPAVNEINKNTNFKFTMDYDEDRKICLFKLLGKDAKADHSAMESEELNRLLALLPEALKGQRSVKAMLSEYLQSSGYQHVQSNIIYTLQNAKKNMKAYLKKALINDYGEESRANAVEDEKKRVHAKAIEEARAKKDADEKELWDRVKSWIEKHGGVGKALYHGHVVQRCHPDMGGLVVKMGDGEMNAFALGEVREKGFGKLSK